MVTQWNNPRIAMKEKIYTLLNFLTKTLTMELGDRLLSISLYGSTVTEEIKNVQDVDLFIILKAPISIQELKTIKVTLEQCKEKFTDKETLIKYLAREGPFKIPPIKKYNIALHITIFDLHGIQRVCLQESSLCKSFMSKISVLYGSKPTDIGGKTEVTKHDVLNNALTIPFLKNLIINSILWHDIDVQSEILFGIIEYAVLSSVINALLSTGHTPGSKEECVSMFIQQFKDFIFKQYPKEIYDEKMNQKSLKDKHKVNDHIKKSLAFLTALLKYMEGYNGDNNK